MHQTGVYWQFLGAMQMLAAVLIVIPATTHLGALLFLPIIVNIAMITLGVGFGGTNVITIPMCFAALLLVCWCYDRWETILFRPAAGEPPYVAPEPRVPLSRAERICYLLGLAAGLSAFTGFRGFLGPRFTWIAAGVAMLAALAAVVLGLARAWRARRHSPEVRSHPARGTPGPPSSPRGARR